MTLDTPTSHVLVVANIEPMSVASLRPPQYAVTQVRPVDAIETARAGHCLSVAIVDGACGPEGNAVVGALHILEPHLPILWIASDAARAPSETTAELDRRATGAELTAAILQVLHAGVYSVAAPQLVEATERALTDVFGCAVTGRTTFYSACRRAFAPIRTALSFSGESLAGSIIVGGDRAVLGAIHRSLGSNMRPSIAELHDIAGEIANHVAHRIKRALAAGGHIIENQAPSVLRSADSSLRELTGHPALIARVETPAGPVFAMLVIRSDGPMTMGVCPPDELTPGMVDFL